MLRNQSWDSKIFKKSESGVGNFVKLESGVRVRNFEKVEVGYFTSDSIILV